jgi:hypothetical protein
MSNAVEAPRYPTPHGPVSEAERRVWSQQLQRRVMRLLLQHHQRLFRGQFRAFYQGSDLPELNVFRQYDRLLTLRTLSDELLDDIMPRIRRQLSLQADQARLLEEAPTRGDIDWARTIQRGWQETPGLSPIQFTTRLRQRSTTTPENLFTVAVILAYRQLVRHVLLEVIEDEILSEQERLILSQVDEQAERELAAAYARVLIPAARERDIHELAAQVAARLRPGPNPYRDLVDWWHRFNSFAVGRGSERRAASLAPLRTDEKIDAWLYELWIMLELLHLFDSTISAAPTLAVSRDRLAVTFTWAEQRLELTYNRQVEAHAGDRHGWQHGPGVRPDYTLRRAHALAVQHAGRRIWQEPPIILDAKYYLGGSDPERTHGPIKKLLGDLALIGASQCVLFFPAISGRQMTRTVKRSEQRHHGGTVVPTELRLYRLDPRMNVAQLQAWLQVILTRCARILAARPTTLTCHGAWIDADSMNVSRTLPTSRVICPKPHIGPGVVDLVDPRECLQNPLVCHMIGQPIVPPVVLRSLSGGELAGCIGDLRHATDQALSEAEHQALAAALSEAERQQHEERAEQLRAQILAGVGRAVEQYVRQRGNTEAIREHFEQWVFGDHWANHPWCLTEDVRAMLLSGEYVWQEYQQLGDQLADWAAPAVQYCRALERELKRRLFIHAQWKQYKIKHQYGWTLGTPLHAYKHREGLDRSGAATPHAQHGQHNWKVMCSYLKQGSADEAAYEATETAFAAMFAKLVAIALDDLRNQLAHGGAVSRETATLIRSAVIGSRQHTGAIIWTTTHVRPLDVVSREPEPAHEG